MSSSIDTTEAEEIMVNIAAARGATFAAGVRMMLWALHVNESPRAILRSAGKPDQAAVLAMFRSSLSSMVATAMSMADIEEAERDEIVSMAIVVTQKLKRAAGEDK